MPYDISGGHITSATVKLDDNSIIINIHADDDGVLTIGPSRSTQRGVFMVLLIAKSQMMQKLTVTLSFICTAEQVNYQQL